MGWDGGWTRMVMEEASEGETNVYKTVLAWCKISGLDELALAGHLHTRGA